MSATKTPQTSSPELTGIATEVYTVADFRTLCGLPRGLFEQWRKMEIVRASIRAESGKGRQRLFTFTDLFAGHLAASLRHAGLENHTIKRAVDALYETPWDSGRCILTIHGEDVRIVTPAEAADMQSRGLPVVGANLLVAAKRPRDEIDTQRAMVARAREGAN